MAMGDFEDCPGMSQDPLQQSSVNDLDVSTDSAPDPEYHQNPENLKKDPEPEDHSNQEEGHQYQEGRVEVDHSA